jgi:hypothetical protein
LARKAEVATYRVVSIIPDPSPDGFLGRGVQLTQVPYIHCPQCRLTVYGGIAYKKKKRCPRCDTEMSPSPRPLFRSFGPRSGTPRSAANARGSRLAGGERLNAG